MMGLIVLSSVDEAVRALNHSTLNTVMQELRGLRRRQ